MTLFELFSSKSFHYWDAHGCIYIICSGRFFYEDIAVMVAAGGTFCGDGRPHIRFETLPEDCHMALLLNGGASDYLASDCKLYKEDMMKALSSRLSKIYKEIGFKGHTGGAAC